MCKMKNRPQIQSLAYAVGDVLNRYVEGHNYVLEEGSSAKSLLFYQWSPGFPGSSSDQHSPHPSSPVVDCVPDIKS